MPLALHQLMGLGSTYVDPLSVVVWESADAGLPDVPLLSDRALLERVTRRLGGASVWPFLYAASATVEAMAERALGERLALCPVARQVLELYRREAVPHLAALRCQAEETLARVGRWRRPFVARQISLAVERFLAAAFFPTTEGLQWVGLDNAAGVARASRRDPARWSLARGCAITARMELDRLGVNLDLRSPETCSGRPLPFASPPRRRTAPLGQRNCRA